MPNDPPIKEARAFTTKFNGIAREIINDIGVSLPITPQNKNDFSSVEIHQTKALWDTGATNSAITQTIIQKLKLVPIGQAQVQHAKGISNSDVFLVNIYLPNKFAIPFVRVTEATNIAGHFDIIVGMDIIALGDLSITNFNKKTTVSFRMPSMQEIDYINRIGPTHVEMKVGRNEKCPCGSGKKYKYCHGINF
ncbi:MAG: SEC-C domain-containing protein [Ignavibacteriales bacterium]|nr:SEC-C domain-containing protein [Ignavibacteriales bacterium]